MTDAHSSMEGEEALESLDDGWGEESGTLEVDAAPAAPGAPAGDHAPSAHEAARGPKLELATDPPNSINAVRTNSAAAGSLPTVVPAELPTQVPAQFPDELLAATAEMPVPHGFAARQSPLPTFDARAAHSTAPPAPVPAALPVSGKSAPAAEASAETAPPAPLPRRARSFDPDATRQLVTPARAHQTPVGIAAIRTDAGAAQITADAAALIRPTTQPSPRDSGEHTAVFVRPPDDSSEVDVEVHVEEVESTPLRVERTHRAAAHAARLTPPAMSLRAPAPTLVLAEARVDDPHFLTERPVAGVLSTRPDPLAPSQPPRDSAEITPASGLTARVDETAREMYQLFFDGEYAAALVLSESVLAESPNHPMAIAVAEECRTVIDRKTLAPRMTTSMEELKNYQLDPTAAFVLSLFDGITPLETIADVSGLSVDQVTTLVEQFKRQGIITTRNVR